MIDITWVLPCVLDGTERVMLLMLTQLSDFSVSVSSKGITTFAFLLWLTASYLIQFLPLKLVTDTEHTITSVATMDIMFALSFDFQTCASARNITLINFRFYLNKKPIIVIISDENIFSIFLRLSLLIVKMDLCEITACSFCMLSLLFLNAHDLHIQFFFF